MTEGFESYAANHSARVRVANNARGQITETAKDAPHDFIAQFFRPEMHRNRGWRSVDIAREVQVHTKLVFNALKRGEANGMVELRDGCWWWAL